MFYLLVLQHPLHYQGRWQISTSSRDCFCSSSRIGTRVIYTSSKKSDLGKPFHGNEKPPNTTVYRKEARATLQSMPPAKLCYEYHQESHFLPCEILGTYSEIYKIICHHVLFLKQLFFPPNHVRHHNGFLAGPRDSAHSISPFFRGNLGGIELRPHPLVNKASTSFLEIGQQRQSK